MSKFNIAISCLCVLVGVAAVWRVPARAASNRVPVVQAWEHLAMTTDEPKATSPDVSKKINGLGNEGWQLVDVETYVRSGETKKFVYFFKREKTAE